MNGFVVKLYMVLVNPKTLISLRSILRSSADDSENLIVHVEELIPTLSELEDNDEIKEFIKDIVETIGDGVKYVWFYL